MNKLRRDYPLLRFETYGMDAISDEMVRQLVALNRLRMTHKGRVSNNDAASSALITELAKARGLVCVFILDGRIVAGTINYQAGNNYFLELVAHDPAFNDYRLGMLSCYLTISECIDRGGCEYHLLWGQDEYKLRLKAVQRDLDHLSVYRSRRAMLEHRDVLLKNVRDRALRVARLWLRRARKDEIRTVRMALAAFHGLRSIRNFT
jgi:CelD/BcsL family acetyltransferase involved in cellulose biosynthesis